MVENLEGEEWRDITRYENYQVSNCGRVKSLNYHMTGEEQLLRPATEGGGYLFVRLYKDGKQKSFKVHRLVATAFIPNTENLSDINHKDECKTNNAVSNLEWCDTKYNINYGTHKERMAAALTNGRTSKRVGQFNLEGELIKEWPSTRECGRNGFSQSAVAACCRNEFTRAGNNVYKGYIWKYI